jgi:RNA polymerase sigma factor for flagellar operon FliA
MRALDWAPRSLRARARELERAMAELEGKLQRFPTDEELASSLGISVEELRQLYHDLSRASVVTLDEPLGQGEGFSLLETLKDQRLADLGSGIEAREVRDLVFRVLEELPERDKLVIALYYFEGLTLAEIGRVLGVTESRVSQIHSRAILQLRARLRPELES